MSRLDRAEQLESLHNQLEEWQHVFAGTDMLPDLRRRLQSPPPPLDDQVPPPADS